VTPPGRPAIGKAALVTVAVAIQVSWYYGGNPSDDGPHAEVRMMAANVNRGEADAAPFMVVSESAKPFGNRRPAPADRNLVAVKRY